MGGEGRGGEERGEKGVTEMINQEASGNQEERKSHQEVTEMSVGKTRLACQLSFSSLHRSGFD